MLPSEIVDYLEIHNLWSPATADYEKALLALGISRESNPDFAEFYLHADDGPYFHGQHARQLLQLCWHVLNTHYVNNSKNLKMALKIPDHFILLDSFEGEGGYFYDPHHDCVYDVNLGKDLSDFHAGNLPPKWNGFVDFLKFFFGI